MPKIGQTEEQIRDKEYFRPGRHGDKLAGSEITKIKKPPRAPKHLKKKGRKIWRDLLTDAVATNGWILVVDLPAIEIYCELIDVKDELKNCERTQVVEGPNGSTVKNHPDYQIYLDTCKEIRAIQDRFGFNPVTRRKVSPITTPPDAEKKNKAKIFKI